MQLCFFEDTLCQRLYPLLLTRPAADLRTGILTISEKWKHALQATKVVQLLRKELKDIFLQDNLSSSDPCLWINARYLPDDDLIDKVHELSVGSCLRTDSTVIAAVVDGRIATRWLEEGAPDFSTLLPLKAADFSSIDSLWDLYLMNGDQIRKDIRLLQPGKSKSVSISRHAMLEQEEDIYMEEGVTVEPGAIVSAKEGPVYLGKNATVMSGAIVRGPVAVCEHSIVKMGAKVYGDTTIGPVCKVGGEVSNTVFHSYSNKAHDGYIGNSVIGQWCNIASGTTISNLKINYNNISITDWMSGDEVDTGQQFLGLIMGDHSKTAINCVIDSGSLFGVNSNILTRGFPPRHVPSFSWVDPHGIQLYKLDKAYKAMEAMMKRRGVALTGAQKKLMEYIFEHSRC